jgi:hypothetical protein
VWGIVEAGMAGSSETKNSTVSRVSFGVDVSEITKVEKMEFLSKNRGISPGLNSAR